MLFIQHVKDTALTMGGCKVTCSSSSDALAFEMELNHSDCPTTTTHSKRDKPWWQTLSPLTEETVLCKSGDFLLEVLGTEAAQLLLLHHTRVATRLPTARQLLCSQTVAIWTVNGDLHWKGMEKKCYISLGSLRHKQSGCQRVFLWPFTGKNSQVVVRYCYEAHVPISP